MCKSFQHRELTERTAGIVVIFVRRETTRARSCRRNKGRRRRRENYRLAVDVAHLMEVYECRVAGKIGGFRRSARV